MAKRQSAFNKALTEAQSGETVKRSNRETVEQLDSGTVQRPNGEEVKQSNGETVKQLNSGTVKRELEKISFYIPRMQLDKLDDLIHEYKKRTGKRINRNDIVRALVEDANLNTLLNLIKE